MVNAALHAAARHHEHHSAGQTLLQLFIGDWGGSPTEATAMAELRFAAAAASNGSSGGSNVEQCWNNLPADMHLSPAVASMCVFTFKIYVFL